MKRQQALDNIFIVINCKISTIMLHSVILYSTDRGSFFPSEMTSQFCIIVSKKLSTAEIWIHIWCSFLQKNVWWKISPPTPLLISIVALNQTLFAVQELMSSTNFRVARYTMLWWNKALWLAAVIPVTSFYKSKSFISAYKFLCNRSNFHCWKVQTLNI